MSENLNQSLKAQTRIEWLDVAKGLGVLLVVLGHLWYNCSFPIVNQIIYTFHMPMFFVLSGFVFKKGDSGFGSFVSSKSKRLLLPTLIFFVLGVGLLLLRSNESFTVILRNFFFIDGICPYNDPCWYFITLFQLVVVSYFLNLDKSSHRSKVFIMVVSFVLGLVIYEFEIFIPFGINRTIIAMVFFTLGSLLGQANREGKKIQKARLKFLAFAGCFPLWLLCGIFLNKKISFYRMNLGNYFFFIIASICGSILFIGLCKLLQKTKIQGFLIKTAHNSILIIGTHYFLKLIFETVMKRLDLFKTWPYCLIVVCFTILITLIYNFIAPFFNKYFPAITGNVKWKNKPSNVKAR